MAADMEPTTEHDTEPRAPVAALAVGLAVRTAVPYARAAAPAVAQQYAPIAARGAVNVGRRAVNVSRRAVNAGRRATQVGRRVVGRIVGDSTVFLAGTDSRIPAGENDDIDIYVIFDR